MASGILGPGLRANAVVSQFFFFVVWHTACPCRPTFQERKSCPKSKFRGRISRASTQISRRTSGGKNFGQALEILEKQTFRCGHPWPEGADVHDPRGFKKTSVRKTLGWIFVPYTLAGVSETPCFTVFLSSDHSIWNSWVHGHQILGKMDNRSLDLRPWLPGTTPEFLDCP